MTTDRLERVAAWTVLGFVGLLCFAAVMEWTWFIDATGGIFTADVELSPASLFLLMWAGAKVAEIWRNLKKREHDRAESS